MPDAHRQPDLELLLAQREWVHALSRRLVGEGALAEDLAQDSMLRALSHPPRVDGNVRQLRAWLRTVLGNRLRTERRSAAARRSRETAAAAPEGLPPTDEIVARADQHRRVVNAVMELAEPGRSTLLRHFYEGLSVQSIATQDGLEASAVRKRLSRAIAALRQRFDAEAGGRRAHWTSALVPLARRAAAPSARISGGLAMGKALQAGVVVCVLLLGYGAWSSGWILAGPEAESSPAAEPSMMSATVTAVPVADADPAPLRVSIEDPVESEGKMAETALLVRVLDRETGLPLPDVIASVGNQARWTDAHGEVRLILEPGEVALQVRGRAADHRDALLELEPLASGEQRTVEVRLDPGREGVYFLRLVDDESGTPIAGAKLHDWVQYIGRGDDPWSRSAPWDLSGAVVGITDDDGLVELTWRELGMEGPRIEAPGYGPLTVSPREGWPDPEHPETLRAERCAKIEGVLSGADGGPLVGATAGIVVKGWNLGNGGSGQEYRWTADSDSSGRFVLEGLPASAPYDLVVRLGHELLYESPEQETLAPGEVREFSWSQGSGAGIEATLRTAAGEVVPDVVLMLYRADARQGDRPTTYFAQYQTPLQERTTDSRGRASFEDLPEGDYWVGPRFGERVADESVASFARRVRVPAERAIELTAHTGLYLAGRVRGVDGESLEGVPCWAGYGRSSGNIMADTDADGRFRLGPLAPGLHGISFGPSAEAHGRSYLGTSVEAQAGDEDLEVSLAAAGTLGLRAEDASTGQPLAAQFLVGKGPLRRYAGGYQETPVTRKRLQLEPGLYDVIATRTAEGLVGVLRGVEVSADASAGELVVPLSPGGWLQIRAEGATHMASFEIRVDGLSFVKLGIQPGASVKALIPPGRVVVSPSLGDSPGPEPREVWLEAGSEQELVFRWER